MKDRKDDIQMLAHLMLIRLAGIMPAAVLQRMLYETLSPQTLKP